MIKKIAMHSLRWKIFAVVMSLGISTSQMIYIPYQNYIKTTYRKSLTHALRTVEIGWRDALSDPEKLVSLGTAGSQEYWDIVASLKDVSDVFDLSYLYYVRRSGNTFQFLLASEESPDTPVEEVFSSYEERDVPQAMEAAYRTKALQITPKPHTDSWGTFVSAYIPIMNNGTVLGVLGADCEIAKIRQYERRSQVMLIIAMIIGTIATFLLSMSIIKPIRELKNAAQTLAKGDLTRPFTMKGKDELAEMSQTLNQAREGIKKLVVSIKNETATISDIGDDLAANMNQTAAAVNQITANVQSIKNQVMNQSASVRETNSTMEDLVQNIDKLDGHVGNQSGNISQATAAIEQMVANINSVTQTLVSNAGNVQALKEASEVGHNGLQEVATDIQEIVRNSEGLLEINAVMGNIASQTNLLSMNAAIEAAHAGEAGKGFAVVADEIRKLAESSSEQSKTIGAVLKKIKTSIDNITRSTENVLNNFAAIDTSVKVVAEQEENIRSAMEEQGVGSKQILESAGTLNEITRQVKSGSHDMHEGAKEVIRESENLEKATAEITVGMNEMANGANQINLAVNHVNEISGKNRQAIDVLVKEVANFICDAV